MSEREPSHYQLAITASEAMYALLEAEHRQGKRDLDAMMRRFKDLAAYSLTHAEIMDQREGVELLALARFFGMISDSRFHQNQERLGSLSEETLAYPGQAETIVRTIQLKRDWKLMLSTDKPVYQRYETFLLEAFDGNPHIMTPDKNRGVTLRI